ncbi:MAG: endo alpha-1,4 polygalactosaminidase [Candidatus Riflebacteria bacterium]|nr:endo alpha-1,4 polygalactosaminidase [Candidatus Riflebacteria bacterium]
MIFERWPAALVRLLAVCVVLAGSQGCGPVDQAGGGLGDPAAGASAPGNPTGLAQPSAPSTGQPLQNPIATSFAPSSPTGGAGSGSFEKILAKGPKWSWVWQYTGQPVSTRADLHVLDGFDHSAGDYKQIVDKGSFPVAYFSCSFEGWRPDAGKWTDADKGPKMDGWDENWPNPGGPNFWSIMEARLDYMRGKMAQVTGGTFVPRSCGIEWDNVDLYDSIGLGHARGLEFLQRLKSLTESKGFIFALKNCVEMVPDLKGVELYVNEQAQQYGEIATYQNVGVTSPVLNVEYERPSSSPGYVYTLYYPDPKKIDGNGLPVS